MTAQILAVFFSKSWPKVGLQTHQPKVGLLQYKSWPNLGLKTRLAQISAVINFGPKSAHLLAVFFGSPKPPLSIKGPSRDLK